MYSSHGIWLIVTGFILLLSMVGSIVISLKPSTAGGLVNKPLSKDHPKVPKGQRRFHTIEGRSIAAYYGISEFKSEDESGLNPHFVTGFCDAESWFQVSIVANPKSRLG